MTCDIRIEPVVPVRDPHGPTTRVGLRELLCNAHNYAELDINIPPAEAMMLRVLYTITARITGLDQHTNRDEFLNARNTALTAGRFDPDAVDRYLNTGEWDLFHPRRPWIQDPRLTEQSSLKSINTLDPTRPGDASPIWWHYTHTECAPPMPAHEALLWLLTAHGYGPAGGGGAREVTSGGRTVRDQYMNAGPLRGSISAYPIGRTLYETLLAGVPSPTGDTSVADIAPWETAELHDPLGEPGPVTWPAGVLVGRSRHGLLLDGTTSNIVDGCYYTWGLKAEHPFVFDPYCIYERNPKPSAETPEWYMRRGTVNRAVWRETDALIAQHSDRVRPQILVDAAALPEEVRDALRVRVIGWDQDRQAKDRAWYASDTPTVLPYLHELDPTAADRVANICHMAETVARMLTWALSSEYRNAGLGAASPWTERAVLRYWSLAERYFWRNITNPDANPARELTQTATRVVTDVVGSGSADVRVARMAAVARQKISAAVIKETKKKQKEEVNRG